MYLLFASCSFICRYSENRRSVDFVCWGCAFTEGDITRNGIIMQIEIKEVRVRCSSRSTYHVTWCCSKDMCMLERISKCHPGCLISAKRRRIKCNPIVAAWKWEETWGNYAHRILFVNLTSKNCTLQVLNNRLAVLIILEGIFQKVVLTIMVHSLAGSYPKYFVLCSVIVLQGNFGPEKDLGTIIKTRRVTRYAGYNTIYI